MSKEKSPEDDAPVKDFVSDFLKQVKEALKEQDFVFCSKDNASVIMDISATQSKGVGGGLRVKILNLEGSKEGASSQRMTVYAKKEPHIHISSIPIS